MDEDREDAEWFRVIVNECRDGLLHDTNYHFMHGRDTWVTGSWLSSTNAPQCGVAACVGRCRQFTDPKVDRASEWSARPQECDLCRRYRDKRSIVITKNTRELEPRMAAARLITPFNRPRYYAAQNRARRFARTEKTQLLWVQCEDFPIER